MMLGLLLLPLMVTASPASSAPPACASTIENNYQEHNCSGLIVRRKFDNSMLEIDCVGQKLDCSKIHLLQINSYLDKVEVTNCSVTSLACAMSALGVTGMDTLHLWYAKTPLTAEMVSGLAFRQLWIYKSDIQRSLPMEAITAQPNLARILVTDGGRFDLPARLPPTGLSYIEVSSREIPHLGEDVFVNQGSLKSLALWNDSMEEIHVNAFRGLSSLTELGLHMNPLTSLPPGVFHHSPGLRVLTLNGSMNRLQELQEGVFSGLLKLEELSINNAANISMRVASRSFANMRSLQNLSLSADVPELPADVFQGTTALLNLDLKYNQLKSLPDTIFQGMRSVATLDLSHNRLEDVSGALFAPLRSLREVYLQHNHIAVLPSMLFTTDKLEILNLSDNRITTIQNNSIAHAFALDLSHNQISWGEGYEPLVDGVVPYDSSHTPLFNLKHVLRELNLSYNHITRLFPDLTRNLVHLRSLDLSYNNITELNEYDVTILGSNDTVVNLRHNQIFYLATYYENMTTYPSLKLGHNPYNCDCSLYHLLNNITDPKFKYDAKDASCATPLSLKGVPLTSVPTDDLTCDIPKENTPNGCSCVRRSSKNRTECTCQDLTEQFGHFFDGNNTDLSLKSVHNLELLPASVSSLNLSNIGLEAVPDIPKTVAEIDLSHNMISYVPLNVLERNITLHLGNNPIACDCGNYENVNNLQKYIIGRGFVMNNINCHDGRKLEQIELASLCLVFIATLLGGIACGLALITSILAFVYYKYSIEIKVWLYKHGCDWLLKEESLDAEKTYDVFLSYSHEDEEFITNMLLPELDRGYKVCVHTRDFIPGEEIAAQIYRSVSESRRTLIVFSNNFVQSLWGIEEFRAAYLQGLNDRRVRAVVILFGDIDMSTVSDDIKTYLSLTTYVKWGDSGFWDKLRYALPRKVKAKDVRLKKRVEIATEKLCKGFNGIVVEANPNDSDVSKIRKDALNTIINENGKLVNYRFEESQNG